MFLEGAALSGYENILLGDLNFHLDKHDTRTLKFYDILEQFSFTQLVNTPTHIQGHILDALCVRDSFSWAISPKVIGGLSDHQAIIFSLIFPGRESCKFQCVPVRKIHKINISDFRMDILKSDLIRCPYKTASLLSHQYFNTLRSLLDKHAPIMKKNITRHAETGFMNCDILKAKRLKRKYERAWHREYSASNRSRYRAAINHYNFLLEKSKCNHYSNIVAENQGNPKALWNCFKKILHRSSVAVLPDYTNKTDLANTFCKFFYDKILKIRSTLQSSIPSSVTRPNPTKNTLSSFTPVSEEELLKILKSSPSKSCDLDPIPTSLVKECADILITPITKIVNYSITEGSFPNCFKMAYVTPFQKKPSLDRNILKNYRPVSNLSFIFKLIEKDTIDHSLLYDCLHDWFGLDGTVLSWIKSYLSNRKQKIKIGDSFSEAVILPFGVPQGSVLGPLLFTLYTSPLSQVISKFNVTHHLYADDTQIYLAVDSRNFDSSMEELTECLKSVQERIDGVKLKLNPEKTEFIIIGQKAIRESLAPNFPVPLLQNNITP